MQVCIGDPIYGYLGAQFDRVSGLLYINGAYYDPVTGRFLSPSSDGSNPYVPLGGAALAPILILALLGRRKKGKIWTGWLVIALMVSAGLTMAACGGQPMPQPAPTTPRPITTPPTPISKPVTAPSSVTPTPSPMPLQPTPPQCPTPPSTPTLDPDEVLDDSAERAAIVYQAALSYHGDLPVEFVLAIAAAESGADSGWDNTVNGDGIMQVTVASGHHESHGEYTNTRTGIEANIQDGIDALNDWRRQLANGIGDYEAGLFDDLTNASVIRTALHYNGGYSPITLYALKRGGVRDYLARVARQLENTVPSTFGVSNAGLVDELRKAQVRVDEEVAKRSATPTSSP